jgi:hypothetical protein
MPMTAMLSTPRLELLDCLLAADLEVDRLRAHLRGLGRGLIGARLHLAQPGGRTALGRAYLRQLEGAYEEAMAELRAARREAQSLARAD